MPCVLESRSAGQRALAPPTDGRPTFGNPNANSATMQPLSNSDTDATNRNSTTTFSQPFPQPSCNRFPTPRQPSGTSTNLHPSFNRHATASQSQQRLICLTITFQPPESAKRTIPRLANHQRLNHPSCRIQERFRHNHPTSAILQFRQHRAAWPWLVHQLPRPLRHFLHHPRREGSGVRSAYLQGDGGLGMAPRVRRVGARSAACCGLPRRATVERRVYNFPAQGDCAGGKNMIQ